MTLIVDDLREQIVSEFKSARSFTPEQREIILEKADNLAKRLEDRTGAREMLALLINFCYDKPFFRKVGEDYSNPDSCVRIIRTALALYYLDKREN